MTSDNGIAGIVGSYLIDNVDRMEYIRLVWSIRSMGGSGRETIR